MKEVTEFVTEVPRQTILTCLNVLKGQLPTGKAATLAAANAILYGGGLFYQSDDVTTMTDIQSVEPLNNEAAITLCEELLANADADAAGIESYVAKARVKIGAGAFLALLRLVGPILLDIFLGLDKATEPTPNAH